MERPNIVIFTTDQQRACSVLPGDPYKAITPHLDAFREDAVSFEQAYCPAPHCCPSRASLFTGLMPTQHGVWHNVCVGNAITRGLKSTIRPWSLDLRDAGYDLLFAGKWHVSNYQEPSDFGWEHVHPPSMCHGTGLSLEAQAREACEREIAHLRKHAKFEFTEDRVPGEVQRIGQTPYVHYGSHQHPFLAQYFREGDPDDPFGDKTVVDAMLARLDQQAESATPWCAFMGTLGPHDPYIPPQRFLDLYKDIDIQLPDTFADPMLDKPNLYRRTRDQFAQLSREEHVDAIKHYLAFCSYEDWLFGRVIEKLKLRGDYENTVILYLSDHGDYLGDHGLWCKGLPSFLSAYHVPAILKLPGHSGAATRREFVSLCDIGPTLLELAGARSSTKFAGRSLLPLIPDPESRSKDFAWRDALFFQSNGNETYGIQRSILTKRWRYVYNGFDYDELYDLTNDPGQMTNLAERPESQPVIREMAEKIWRFGLQHEEHLVNDYIMTALADYGPGLAFDSTNETP